MTEKQKYIIGYRKQADERSETFVSVHTLFLRGWNPCAVNTNIYLQNSGWFCPHFGEILQRMRVFSVSCT